MAKLGAHLTNRRNCTMRKRISVLAIVAVLFAICSCQKETTTVLRATISQFNSNDGKVYLHDDFVNWHVDDELWVNNCPATISGTVSPFTVAVEGLESAETYYAVYPKAYSTMQSASSATVTIPAVQKYRTDNAGRQIIDAPMAAKQVRQEGVTTLKFYNLCSLFEVNPTVVPVGATIKSISVFNIANNFAGAAINGTATVDFTQTPIAIGAVANGTRATKLEVNAVHTQGRKYYVAVAPVQGAQFQVVVDFETSSHNLGVAQVKQANATNNLPANKIAPIDLTSSYDPYFGGYYVSPGNVQCYVDDNGNYRYRFAAHQWEMYGNSNLTLNESGEVINNGALAFPIDLFPYGQTGDPTARTFASVHHQEMVDFVENSAHIPCDFEIGVPALEWRVPHQEQTMGVLTKNEGTIDASVTAGALTLGKDATMATITVTDDPHGHTTHAGLVLLPDDYPGTRFAVGDGDVANISFGAEEWLLMESLGAIFLPLAGQIQPVSNNSYEWNGNHSTGMGFYTLKDPANGQNCHYLLLNDVSNRDFTYIANRSGGEGARAFRLIRPVPGYTPNTNGTSK